MNSHDHRAVWAALIFAAGCLLYLTGLGARDVIDDDEALDAAVVRSIAGGESILVPRFNATEFAPKPPLFYWLSALSCRALGRTDVFAIRLPAAIAAAAGLAIVFLLGAGRMGTGRGLWAALMLSTFPVYASCARMGRSDMFMSVLLLAGWTLLIAANDDRQTAPVATRWRIRVAALCFGLSILTKGAAGAGLAVLGVVGLSVARRSWRPIVMFKDPVAILLGLAPPALWYAAASVVGGRTFLVSNVFGENFRLLFGNRFDSILKVPILHVALPKRPFSYHSTFYLLYLFLRTLPWCLFVLAAALALPKKEQREPIGAAGSRADPAWLAWIASGWLLLTLASRKSPYYALPLVPAVALCLASLVPSRSAEESRPGAAVVRGRPFLIALAAAIGLALLTSAVAFVTPWDAGRQAVRILGGRMLNAPWIALPVFLVIAAALAAGMVSLSRRLAWTLLATVGLIAVPMQWFVHPWLAPIENEAESLRSFTEGVNEVSANHRPAFFHSAIDAVVYYHGPSIPVARTKEDLRRLAGLDKVLLMVTRGSDEEALASVAGVRGERLLSGRGRISGNTIGPVHLVRLTLDGDPESPATGLNSPQ